MTSAVQSLINKRQAELAKEYGGERLVPTAISNPAHVVKFLEFNRYSELREARRKDEAAFTAAQRELAERLKREMV